MYKILDAIMIFIIISTITMAAPSTQITNDERVGKTLNLYDDYYQHHQPYVYDVYDGGNELSRAAPSRRRHPNEFDSPIYYVRLPPQPYMYVPGLGYMPRTQAPSTSIAGHFLNLPLDFVANGKPNAIYQWSPQPPTPTTTTAPPINSNIQHLNGQFVFNGKPEDLYVLRDSYDALYADALQNFYP